LLAVLASTPVLTSPVIAAEPPSFQEVLDVNLVNVDVVVVDKKGSLVTDLRREDFVVIDDGKKVEIQYFAQLAAGGASAGGDGAAAASVSSALEGPSGAGQDARRFIILVDLDSQQLLNRNRVLDDISAYLDGHADEVTAMVITYGGSGLDVELPFSASPVEWKTAIEAVKKMPSRGLLRATEQRRLVESIKHIQRRADSSSSLQGARDRLDELIGSVRTEAESMHSDGRATLRAIHTLVSVLSTVEGPKSLLYVGDGVPVHPGEDLYNLLADVFENDPRFGQGPRVATVSGAGSGDSSSGGSQGSGGLQGPVTVTEPIAGMAHSTQSLRTDALDFDLTPDLRALSATANSHRVTIYGLSSDVAAGAAQADMNLGARIPTSALAYDMSRSQLREQSLQIMAADTGGLALPPNAGVGAFLDRVLADDASRYSLAYVSPHGGDSRFHKIKVKVNRKGVDLRHRAGYVDRPRSVGVGDLIAGALLLGSGENPHRMKMEVVSQAPAENDEVAVTFGLHIPIDELRLAPAGDNHEAKLDLFILSKDANGAFAPMRSVSFSVTLSPAEMAQSKGKYYGATLPLSLAKGRQAVAIGLVEPAVQRTSVLRTELDVGG
jgi:VWFA-related protein